ncbi:hypothetical protein OUZ56_001859 [Daphnia magna]|uniref:Uncharacterized protein n=1 Tax=Daphnia magna TaxID=35525 RepID=A0ABR0A4B3_9CRUS|nr:hypothetical protein OUZ56_001859 [Daphnia magna]
MEKIIKPTRRAFRSDRPTISASHKSIFKFLCAFHAFLELVQPYTQLDDGHDQHDMISLHTLVQTKRKNPKADSTQRITWSSFIRPCVVTQHV